MRSTGVVGRIRGTKGLAPLLGGNAAFAFSEHSTWLALMVYAFNRGGAPEAGLVGFVVLLPAMLAAPIGAAIAQRMRPKRALAVAALLLSSAHVATALAMWAGAPMLAYAAGGVGAALITLPRPIANSLLPRLAKAPQDLIAANVVSSMIEQSGRCAGPIVGGVVMGLESPAAVFAIGGTASCISFLASLSVPPLERVETERESVVGELARGFIVVARDVRLRWILAVLATVAMCNGVIDVLSVTFAQDRLGLGDAAAGWLMAAFGLGAVLGGAAGSGLVGGARMSGYFAAAATAIGVSFVAVGGLELLVLGLVAFAANGAGQALLIMICNVAIQRHAPPEALTRVFGVIEGLHMLGMAVGSLLFAQLAGWLSLATAMVGIGVAVLGITVVALMRLISLRVLDAPPPHDIFERVAADPLFAPLALPHLERLAKISESQTFAAGDVIVREGEPGEHYFLIRSGDVDVTANDKRIGRMSKGESFGEIALVRDTPRVATVTAATDVEVLRISRDELLQALTLSAESRHRAHATVEKYLGE